MAWQGSEERPGGHPQLFLLILRIPLLYMIQRNWKLLALMWPSSLRSSPNIGPERQAQVLVGAERVPAQAGALASRICHEAEEASRHELHWARACLITNLHYVVIFAQRLYRPPTLQTEDIFHRHFISTIVVFRGVLIPLSLACGCVFLGLLWEQFGELLLQFIP